jgi:hypothetical protein
VLSGASGRPARHRRLAAIVVGTTALAALGLLAGCGTGQVAETADTVPSVPGANLDVEVNGGVISVRDATIDYSGPAGYRAGGDAPLSIRIINGTSAPVTLSGATAMTRDGKGSLGKVLLAGGAPSGAPSAESPVPATPKASGSGAPASSSRAPSGSPSGSPSESASPPPPGNATISVPVPAAPDGLIILSKANSGGSYLLINGLTTGLRPGESVRLVLTFTLADGTTVQVGGSTVASQQLVVPVAVPVSPVPRASVSPAGE